MESYSDVLASEIGTALRLVISVVHEHLYIWTQAPQRGPTNVFVCLSYICAYIPANPYVSEWDHVTNVATLTDKHLISLPKQL